jgi:hypothetical protein
VRGGAFVVADARVRLRVSIRRKGTMMIKLFFDGLLVICAGVITWFAGYAVYRLISED